MKWTEYHERKVLELYKRIKPKWQSKLPDKKYIRREWKADKRFTCPFGSILMKLQNIRYLDTNGKQGLSNSSKLNKKIFYEDRE